MRHSIALNRLQFLEKIYDYQKHPTGWMYTGKVPGVLMFHSGTNSFCVDLEPAMEIIAKRGKGKYEVYTVDIDLEKELSRALLIENIPTFYLCTTNGSPVIIKGNINLKHIRKWLETAI